MNLSMEADSLDELHSLITETLHLVLIDLLQDDELNRYLRERGWTARGMPADRRAKNVRFDVPWELIAAGAMERGSARRPH